MPTVHTSSRPGNTLFHVGVVAFFCAFAILETWPLALHFTTQVIGLGGDAFQTVWHLWLVRRWPETGASPFATKLVFWPTGTTLYIHASNVLNALLTWPILRTLGPVASYNAAALLNMILNAIGAYLLAWRLSDSRSAGVLAGLGFGFCAYFSGHLLGHLVLVSAASIPFGALLVLRSLETGGARTTVLAGLCVAWSLLTLAHVLFLGLFAGLAFFWLMLGRAGPGPMVLLRRMAAIAAAALAVSAPLLFTLAREITSTPGSRVPLAIQQRYSADLLGWITPSPLHPVFGPLVSPFVETQMGHPSGFPEGLVFPGLAVLVLAVIGAIPLRRSAPSRGLGGVALGPGFWATLALVAIVLSLGPQLKVSGQPTGWPLPFAAIAGLPGLGGLSSPGRFAVLAQLALCMLAARGLVLVQTWNQGGRGRAMTAVVLALVAFECLFLPYPASALPSPSAFHEVLRREGRGGAVVDVPYATYDPLPMVDQMAHERPILNGYVSRFPANCVGCVFPPPLSALRARVPGRDILPPVDLRRDGGTLLRSWNVDAVLVHLDRLPEDRTASVRETIASMGLLGPVFKDLRLEAYRVPDASGDREEPPAVAATLSEGANFEAGGWSAPDLSGSVPERSIVGEDAGVLIWATAPTKATLTFVARKTGPGKMLEARLNGESRFDERVRPEGRTVDIDLDLRAGANVLVFRGGMTLGPMTLTSPR